MFRLLFICASLFLFLFLFLSSCHAGDRVTIKINNDINTQHTPPQNTQQHGAPYTNPHANTVHTPPLRAVAHVENVPTHLLIKMGEAPVGSTTPVPPVAAAQADALNTPAPVHPQDPTPHVPTTSPNFASLAETCLSTTIMPHVYTLCLFHNVTSRLYHGDQQRVLGLWGHYNIHPTTHELRQTYNDGHICEHSTIPAYQMKKRMTEIVFACGDTPALSAITESSICEYQLTFYHPLVCTLPTRHTSIQQSIASPIHPSPDIQISSMQHCIDVLWDSESTAKQQEQACAAFTKTTTTTTTTTTTPVTAETESVASSSQQ